MALPAQANLIPAKGRATYLSYLALKFIEYFSPIMYIILEATRGSFRTRKFQILAGGGILIIAKNNKKSERTAIHIHTCTLSLTILIRAWDTELGEHYSYRIHD